MTGKHIWQRILTIRLIRVKCEMTYQEAYRKMTELLEGTEIQDAVSDAWILMEHVTGMSRTRFFADGDRQMDTADEKRLAELAVKRSKHIPVQHLTGVQEFMGIEFLVNEDVLVPRQDTEILVEEAEKVIGAGRHVLDMCTGSGCIAVSLKVRNPELRCAAVDISDAALVVAKENARRQGIEIEFVQSDMFAQVQGEFDMIVSNPPYIPTTVIEGLEEEVRLHDPFAALDGREDGLHFYRILAKESPRYLRDGGRLYMEIGYDQKEAVEGLLREEGFEQIRTQKDLAGLDRVVSGVYNRHSK